MQTASRNDLLAFSDIDPLEPNAVRLVGGKALSLARLARAGLPVPTGFCLSTQVYRRLNTLGLRSDAQLWTQLAHACSELGLGPVAVRSSATAEDGATTSFAGQQETFLGVQGLDDIEKAIERCWNSLAGERAQAYRLKQGLEGATDSMAVVVQQLVPAEVAGVLFTHDPLDESGQSMLVEAAWGLGEGVVSGRVEPDRFHLDRLTGQIRSQHIAEKRLQICSTGEVPVPSERQRQSCLSAESLLELAALARQVEALYGEPRDLEWAWAKGQFWLLQARPITAGGAAEREQVRQQEIATLASLAEPSGTVWARFNLSESLPDPTPLSWDVARRMLAGQGGFGYMYRDLGYEPDPSLDEQGIFDLVCGRPYCNLSREVRLHYRQLPFEHSFAALKAEPMRALYPSPSLNPSRAGWRFWLMLPFTLVGLMLRMGRAEARRTELQQTFPDHFRNQVIPAFVTDTTNALLQDLNSLSNVALLELFQHWLQRTVVDFARESLKPTALAGRLIGRLEQQLAPRLRPPALAPGAPYVTSESSGMDAARRAVRELILGVKPEPEADLPGALEALLSGRVQRTAFLEQFGHRGDHEMELARPRWGEDPDRLLPQYPNAARLEGVEDVGAQKSTEATSLFTDPFPQAWEHILAETKLTGQAAAHLRSEVDALRALLALRETAKHHLLRGFAVLRRYLVELDRRLGLNGRIFYLRLEELPQLVREGLSAEDLASLASLARNRQRRRTLALSLELPAVLFSDDLGAIGRPTPLPSSGEALKGVPLSAGVAEAPALVLEEVPSDRLPQGPYILVCPSTDPAWVPLFLQAVGLVLETGGVLSHGAIVAREFGLPAVAGVPGLLRRIRTGQRLRVDGATGTVVLIPS